MGRVCDNCQTKMLPWSPRKRQPDGSLWCPACVEGRPGRPRAMGSLAATSAASVSALLRRSGFNPLGSGTSRTREGLRISQSLTGVTVSADMDSDNAAERMSIDAEETCREAGLNVERIGPNIFRVAARGDRDDLAIGYVECTECGHPIENHTAGNGCAELGGECPCTENWTRAEVAQVRKREGLPARRKQSSFQRTAADTTCRFCDRPATQEAEWRSRDGLSVVDTVRTCDEHSDALSNWSGQVQIHRLAHSQNDPWACVNCGKTVKHKMDECPSCGADYGWEENLDYDGPPVTSSRKVAHDSGDGETIYHCPFCGSGQVVGGSDGTIECEFCQSHFTVQVQPDMPTMPQTVNGQPSNMPGMPGGPANPDAPAPEQQKPNPFDPADKPDPFDPSTAPTSTDQAKKPDSGKPASGGGDKPPWLKGSAKTAERDYWDREVIGVDKNCPRCGTEGEPTGYGEEHRCPSCRNVFWPQKIREPACGAQKGKSKMTCELAQGHPGEHGAYAQNSTGWKTWGSAKPYFITAEGAVLDEASYLRHLAIHHADADVRHDVVAAVREERKA